jgi:putative methionine-R-sulfoxide reductase with GAF domain
MPCMYNPTERDYLSLRRTLRAEGDREARMRAVVDALWGMMAPTGLSWIGFYIGFPPIGAGEASMMLGPRRDKPACSPIGVHGACGRCWRSKKPLVVTDVAKLGAGYIACDPRDKSEVVVPCFDADGTCWGVLDADSYDVKAFSEDDALGLVAVLEDAGLSERGATGFDVDVV